MAKTNNEIAVEGHDNRLGHLEDGKHGFGYVYFNDGKRVGWDNDGGVWECNNNASWGPTNQKHLKLAEEYLREKGLLTKS